MNIEITVRRAQLYRFLSSAFLYPTENWTEDMPLLSRILADLEFSQTNLSIQPIPLPDLQMAYRRAFGITGSLCYETEYGLPHEFRQSQEMADLNGFYRAFGFTIGGLVRERPDHLAVELEFMYTLALKEAYAGNQNLPEQLEICLQAQRKFLQEHLGRWIEWFAQSLALNADSQGIYQTLAHFAAAFVRADAARLGVQPEPQPLSDVKHTPFDPNFSCAACPVAEIIS